MRRRGAGGLLERAPRPPWWERSGGEMREIEKGEDRVGEEWLGVARVMNAVLTP
jgi:hypothetical protein